MHNIYISLHIYNCYQDKFAMHYQHMGFPSQTAIFYIDSSDYLLYLFIAYLLLHITSYTYGMNFRNV